MINFDCIFTATANALNYRTVRKTVMDYIHNEYETEQLRVSIAESGRRNAINFAIRTVADLDALVCALFGANDYNSTELVIKVYSENDCSPLVEWNVTEYSELATVKVKMW